MRKILLSFWAILACIAFPSLSRAEMTITWDFSAMDSWSLRYNDEYYPNSFSESGITLTVNNSYGQVNNTPNGKHFYSYSSPGECGGEFTFSCATANITRIEITCDDTPSSIKCSSSGWSIASSKLVWTGSASSVDFEEGGVDATQIVFTTDEEVAPDKLSGVFSVSPCKSVKFSKGNLQYQASTGSWRFANKQYEVIGNNPGNTTYSNRNTQSAWIDLFGWGTGDNPSKAESSSSYYNTYTEWGEQFDTGNGWYTLSYDEWRYLLGGRYDYDPYYNPNPGVSYALGTVNGVGGLILLPDDWSTTYYSINNPNPTTSYYYPYTLSASYSDNVITLSEWTTSLEAHGAVFLPATGLRSDPPSMSVNGTDYGNYWTSTPASMSSYSYSLLFGDEQLELSEHSDRYLGRAVRLVSTYHIKPDASVNEAPTAKTGLVYDGSWQDLINTGTANGGRLIYSESSYSLDHGSDFSPSEQNAGTYYVYYMAQGDENHCDYVPSQNMITITIAKANSSITLTPAAISGLEYTGSAQTLVTAGSATFGSIKYKVNDGSWSTSLPQATDIGDYTVYYKVDGTGNYNGVAEASLEVSIAAPSSFTVNDQTGTRSALHQLRNLPMSSITINRSLSRDGNYSTLCLPFDLDAAAIASSSLNGFVICELTDMWSVGNELRLLMTQTSTIEAGKPYLVRYAQEPTTAINPLVFNNVTITAEEGLTTDANGAVMHGILEPTVLTSGNRDILFLLPANVLTWASVTNTMNAFRAYFEIIPAAVPMSTSYRRGMPTRIVEQRETPTGIEEVTGDGLPVTGVQKIIRDGQLIIIRNGVEYNANGQILK